MRTTVNLDEALLAETKQVAVQSGQSLTSLLEDALREFLARRKLARTRTQVRLTTSGGSGTLPGVDLDRSAALLEAMDEAP